MDQRRDYQVFVIEDSPLLTRFLVERLRAAEFAIAGQADNAPDGLEGIAETRPDAVIVDLMLRTGTGYDVLRALQKTNGGHHPVKMVLTNFSLPPYEEKAKHYGAGYFFDKATDINLLIETLESLKREANRRNGSEG
jgi:DNA-binding NarL/FixJ family response regulator